MKNVCVERKVIRSFLVIGDISLGSGRLFKINLNIHKKIVCIKVPVMEQSNRLVLNMTNDDFESQEFKGIR